MKYRNAIFVLAMGMVVSPALAYEYPRFYPLPASVEAVVPDGWHINGEVARGDLNQDEIVDAALVVERDEGVEHIVAQRMSDGSIDNWDTNEAPRVLLVLFGSTSGGFSTTLVHSDIIFRADMGGVRGDPFQGVAIDRGSIVINEYGGSNVVWSEIERYRFRKNQWRLIGATSSSLYISTGQSKEIDKNYLSGKTKITLFKQEKIPIKATWREIEPGRRYQYLKSNLPLGGG
jgi:hypothetical protein